MLFEKNFKKIDIKPDSSDILREKEKKRSVSENVAVRKMRSLLCL